MTKIDLNVDTLIFVWVDCGHTMTAIFLKMYLLLNSYITTKMGIGMKCYGAIIAPPLVVGIL